MMGHNICFEEVTWKIIPKLSFTPSYLEHCLNPFKTVKPILRTYANSTDPAWMSQKGASVHTVHLHKFPCNSFVMSVL